MPLANNYVVPYPEVLPYTKQGVVVPGTQRPGQTGHYQNGIFGLIDENTPNSLTTVDKVFLSGLSAGRDRDFLGHRPILSTNPLKYANHYVWESYGAIDLRRRYIGSALTHLFRSGELAGGEFETVGLWSPNRPEWQIIDIALQSYKKVAVSLYDTLGKDSVEYIINHAHLTVVFTTAEHIPTLLKLAPKLAPLKLIVSIDKLTAETQKILSEWSQQQGFQLKELWEIEALGKANLTEPVLATPEQLASICYTSGTTAVPKGVLLTHKNLALATQSNLYGLDLPADATMLSYLPLAHIYGRVAELSTVAIGARIGFFTGDPLRLLEDAQILKPNYLPSVPRVLNRIYQAAMTAGNVPGLKGALFKKAVQAKLDNLHATGENKHALWDRLVFRKIQAVMGGNLMLVSTGSAPINIEVIDFLKIGFACDVREGYGLTETCATATLCIRNDPSASGTIGPPQPCNEIKLIDVPLMNYLSTDKPNPRGELLVRGANCFSVYYKDEKNTRETVDDEGWMHSGDVAEVDPYGRFKIIDRVKNIMKLAQGEYVALEKIENVYSVSPIVAQLYVHGDSLQSFLLAVVVPDPVQLANAASAATGQKVTAEDLGELVKACQDERVNKHILQTLTREAKKSGLNSFEYIKRIHLTLDPFTVEDNTLTPTLKLRRKDAYAKFKAELDGLYALGDAHLPKL